MININIYSNRGDLLIATSEERYMHDLVKNKKFIVNAVWHIKVVYEEPQVPNKYSLAERKKGCGKQLWPIINVNGRNVYSTYVICASEYNLGEEGYDSLCAAIKHDFETNIPVKEIKQSESWTKGNLYETHSPE